jgi:hypothetical protein
MKFWFRRQIRHPFFPKVRVTPAREAKGRPPALSGTYEELQQAIARGVSAERVVFVLIECDSPPFTRLERDRLWEQFQTPVYAILVGRDGRATGFECEVQNGFHAKKAGAEDELVCECGRPGRLHMRDDAGQGLPKKPGLAAAGAQAG